MNAVLGRHYYNVRKPGSYSGVDALHKAVKGGITKAATLDYLRAQDAYTLHKPLRKTFHRNKTISWGVDFLWQADLVDVKSLAKYNKQNQFILTVIDVLSKHAWAIPLKNKKSESVLQAFKTIFKTGRKPNKLNSDCGGEFESKKMAKFLKENKIIFYTTKGEKKASVVERFNKTMKGRMWRYFTGKNTLKYIDILQRLVHSYNNTVHKSTGIKPVDVNADNESDVRERLYGEDLKPVPQPVKYKYRVGDTVRISKLKDKFEKSYLPNWTEELFTVSERIPRRPPVYRVKDSKGELIDGTFYAQELQLVTKPKDDKLFVVQDIVDRKKRNGVEQVLVKWRGHPKSMNSWIPVTELVSL